MPNINSIINKSNTIKLNKEQYNEAPKCNCNNKTECPLRANVGMNAKFTRWRYIIANHAIVKIKRYTSGPPSEHLNKGTIIINEKYKHSTSLSNYMWEIKNRQGTDPILKWEIVKKKMS